MRDFSDFEIAKGKAVDLVFGLIEGILKRFDCFYELMAWLDGCSVATWRFLHQDH